MQLKTAGAGYRFLGIAMLPLAGTMMLSVLNLKGTAWNLVPLIGFLGVLLCMMLVGGSVLRRLAQQDEWGRNGRCARCGYDLAGLEAGSCPECGTHAPE